MQRAVTAAEERRTLTLWSVFLVTLVMGFAIQAAGSFWLRWTADPIALAYRTTLTYTSALIGDAILLPLVNVFIVTQLLEWRRQPRQREIAAAMVGGALLTVGVHFYQAANALLNWTMLEPYRWTPLGYAHAFFMLCELSLVLFFWGQVAIVAAERPRAVFSHRVLFVILCSAVFLRLLLGDYGYFV